MIAALKELIRYGRYEDIFISSRDMNHGIRFNREYLFIADNGTYKEIILKPDQFIRIVEIDKEFFIRIVAGDKVKFSYKIPKMYRITMLYTNGDKKTIYL